MMQDLELARDAALRAGALVRERFRTPHLVTYKSPQQPVTEVDVRVDRFLRDTLIRARPRYGWLSEETVDTPERLAREQVWVVDPIDGTTSFVQERPEFGISIGLARGGEAVLGVVYNPITDELYHGVRGGGAFRNGEPIRTDPTARTLIASPTEVERGDLEPFAAHWSILRLGSTAYKMVKVADGTGSAYFSRTWKGEWDVCAALVIVVEAGGDVLQVDGRRFEFNRPRPTVRGVVCGDGGLVRELLAVLGPLVPIPPGERLDNS